MGVPTLIRPSYNNSLCFRYIGAVELILFTSNVIYHKKHIKLITEQTHPSKLVISTVTEDKN